LTYEDFVFSDRVFRVVFTFPTASPTQAMKPGATGRSGAGRWPQVWRRKLIAAGMERNQEREVESGDSRRRFFDASRVG